MVYVNAHDDLLDEALSNSAYHLCNSTPWLTATVVPVFQALIPSLDPGPLH